MAFGNNIELSERYSAIIDEMVSKQAVTSAMEVPTFGREFLSTKTVKLMDLTVGDASDYDRNAGYGDSNSSAVWTAYTLRYERAFRGLIDKLDMSQTGGTYNADKVLAEFMKQKMIPEIDKVRLATATSTAMGVAGDAQVKYGYTPATGTFLTEITKALRVVKENRHIDKGIDIYLNSEYADILYDSTEVTKNRDITTGLTTLDNRVTGVNGNMVKEVPSDYMKSAFDLGVGIKPSAGAKDVVAVFVAPECVAGIHNVVESGVMDAKPIASGFYAVYRGTHDAIVTKNSKNGIYALIKTAKT